MRPGDTEQVSGQRRTTSNPRAARSEDATRRHRDRRLVGVADGAQHRQDRGADAPRGDHRRGHRRRHHPQRRRLHVRRAAATTSRVRRSRSCRTSTRSARGRPSATRTSRWTARGRSTRRGSGCRSATSTSRSAMGSGRSSTADPALIYSMEMDPYYLAPLGADADEPRRDPGPRAARRGKGHRAADGRDRGALPARCEGERARAGRRRLRRRRRCSRSDYVRAPLRRHDLPPITDGACAVVIARADKARRAVRAAGVDHGLRALQRVAQPGHARPHVARVDRARGEGRRASTRRRSRSPRSSRRTRTRSRCSSRRWVSAPDVPVNPSGGPLAANPIMATGLVRVAEAARADPRSREAPHARALDLGPVPPAEPGLRARKARTAR